MNPLLLAALTVAFFVHPAAAQSTIFLVRHAEKATGGGGDLQDPDLSEAGRTRAASLARILKDAGVAAVFATEFKRTQQTAAPTARAVGVTMKQVPGNKTAALVAKLRAVRGNALVVGHSNTIPEILRMLGVSAPVTIGETDYDNLFVVVLSAPSPQFVHLHYR